MSKRGPQPTRTGQLSGARIKIVGVYNHGLREHIAIVNQGTMAQPLGGWALAAQRSERVYFFPEDLILLPGMKVFIHSGQEALNSPPYHLLWTDEQRWSNRNDIALLFDNSGSEIDRCAYSHKRILGHNAQRRKRLLNNGATWRLVDEAPTQTRKIFRPAKELAGVRHALR